MDSTATGRPCVCILGRVGVSCPMSAAWHFCVAAHWPLLQAGTVVISLVCVILRSPTPVSSTHNHAPPVDCVRCVVVEMLEGERDGLREVTLLPMFDLLQRPRVRVWRLGELVDQPTRNTVIVPVFTFIERGNVMTDGVSLFKVKWNCTATCRSNTTCPLFRKWTPI